MASNDSKHTDQQRYVLQMARQNLALVTDQVESISEDDDTAYSAILKALDVAKDEMEKLA